MTYSYDVTNLGSAVTATKNLTIIRFRTGDTDNAGHLLEDEEITALLAEYSNNLSVTAWRASQHMLAKLQKRIDISGPGGMTISRSQKFSQMKDLVLTLRDQAMAGAQVIQTGTIADRDAIATSTTRDPPIFSVGMDEYK